MKLSTKGRYGLRAMIDLARYSEKEPVSISSIAARQDISERYLEQMTVKGHGDTDFTPVFRLTDRLIQEGELKNLKGLLYFTDGDGIYPDQRPEYDTAFVFLNEELQKGRAPSWAQTLTLDTEWETGT